MTVSYPYDPDPVGADPMRPGDATSTYAGEWVMPEDGWPGFDPEEPRRPPSRHTRAIALGLAAALLAVAIGAGLGATISMRNTTRSESPGAASVTPGAPAGATTGVTVGVVDITTTLAYGGGRGAGTGFVLDGKGRVMTANHVVDGATDIKVQVGGSGPRYDAEVVGRDESADVAVLQVDGAPALRTASVGDSSTVSQGDEVVAVGNAGGQGRLSSVRGTVVALNQTVTVSDVDGSNPRRCGG